MALYNIGHFCLSCPALCYWESKAAFSINSLYPCYGLLHGCRDEQGLSDLSVSKGISLLCKHP